MLDLNCVILDQLWITINPENLNKDLIEMMERDGSVHVDVAWSFDQIKKVGNKKINLKCDLVRVITKNNTEIILGYTKANFKLLSNEQIFTFEISKNF